VNWDGLAWIAVVLLIPLIPAVLIYWTLPPKQTRVTGPFKGLAINLTGAFAGYFLLVLLASGMALQLQPDQDKFPKYEEYKLFGSVDLTGANPNGIDRRLLQIVMFPTVENVVPVGENHFEWTVNLPVRRSSDGKVSFPYEQVILEYKGFNPVQMDLRAGQTDLAEKKILFPAKAVDPKRDLSQLVPVVTTPR
jgi:hypothetical protein